MLHEIDSLRFFLLYPKELVSLPTFIDRPTSLSSELDELATYFRKSDLAEIAGVRPNVLSPSRVNALGRETIDRLDVLWVAIRLSLQLEVEDVQFFLSTRQPGLDFRPPTHLIAEGTGEVVLAWLQASLVEDKASTDQPASAGARSAKPRPLGWAQRTAVSTAQARPGGFRGGPVEPGRAERVAAIAETALEHIDVDVLLGQEDVDVEPAATKVLITASREEAVEQARQHILFGATHEKHASWTVLGDRAPLEEDGVVLGGKIDDTQSADPAIIRDDR